MSDFDIVSSNASDGRLSTFIKPSGKSRSAVEQYAVWAYGTWDGATFQLEAKDEDGNVYDFGSSGLLSSTLTSAEITLPAGHSLGGTQAASGTSSVNVRARPLGAELQRKS